MKDHLLLMNNPKEQLQKNDLETKYLAFNQSTIGRFCATKVFVSMSHIFLTFLMLHLLKELIKIGVFRCVKYLLPNKRESKMLFLSLKDKNTLKFNPCYNTVSIEYWKSADVKTFDSGTFTNEIFNVVF